MSSALKSTFPCIETLLCQNGLVHHLAWHQARINKTQDEYYKSKQTLSLASAINPPKEGVYRARVTYDEAIKGIEYLPYTPKAISSIGLVESFVEYDYKYADRRALQALIPLGCDDVLITCKEELKDTSIANIALWVDGTWLTPQHPLLQGTTRARLLASGFLKASCLSIQSLKKAQKFAIMNALVGFKIIDRLCIKGL